MKLRAPAKINLGLRILRKRSDGYHDLQTMFAAIGLFDELKFELRTDDKIGLRIKNTCLAGRREGLRIPQSKNLVYLAAKKLQKLAKKKMGVSILLTKKIPISAGLGGGSSDAAATLITLNKLWKLKLSRRKLEALGAELGSDVPFFIRGGIQKGSGRGEILKPFRLALPAGLRLRGSDSRSRQAKSFPRFVLLVVPKKIRVSTAWAYRQLSATSPQRAAKRESNQHQHQLPALLKNDFESVVFKKFPGLKKIKEQLLESGAKAAALSGSGSAVYGLFPHKPKALPKLIGVEKIVITKIAA